MFKSDSYVRDKWIGSYLCSSFTSEQVTLGLIFYFIKHSRPLTVPHLSKKVALELASLVVNALTTACCRYQLYASSWVQLSPAKCRKYLFHVA